MAQPLNTFTLTLNANDYTFRLVDLFNLSSIDEALYVAMTQDFDAAKGAYGATVANAFYYASFAKPNIAYETVKKKISEAKEKVPGYQRYDWFVFTNDKFVGTASVRTPDYDIKEFLGGTPVTSTWELSATVTKDYRSKHIVSGLTSRFTKFISQNFPTYTQIVRVQPDNEMVKHLVSKSNFKSVGKNTVVLDLYVTSATFEYDVYALDASF